MNKKQLIFKVITIAAVVITLFLAGWIMAHRLGLVEGLDFGAGAYYYADIPTEQYSEVVNEDAYQTSIPKWVYYVLFFAWGWLMWRLWGRVESGKWKVESGKRRTPRRGESSVETEK